MFYANEFFSINVVYCRKCAFMEYRNSCLLGEMFCWRLLLLVPMRTPLENNYSIVWFWHLYFYIWTGLASCKRMLIRELVLIYNIWSMLIVKEIFSAISDIIAYPYETIWYSLSLGFVFECVLPRLGKVANEVGWAVGSGIGIELHRSGVPIKSDFKSILGVSKSGENINAATGGLKVLPKADFGGVQNQLTDHRQTRKGFRSRVIKDCFVLLI